MDGRGRHHLAYGCAWRSLGLCVRSAFVESKAAVVGVVVKRIKGESKDVEVNGEATKRAKNEGSENEKRMRMRMR